MTTLTLPGVDAYPRDELLSQWYTPPELATRIARWALEPYGRGTTVVEPSAGEGALVGALVDSEKCAVVHAIDISARNVDYLAARFAGVRQVSVARGDFPASYPDGPRPFHLAVANPPFEDKQAETHLMHALRFWASRAVFHVPLTTLAGVDRAGSLWSQVTLHRLVIHARRPRYSGSASGGATEMCTVDVTRWHDSEVRTHIEWWT